jgi:hypothetical protein
MSNMSTEQQPDYSRKFRKRAVRLVAQLGAAAAAQQLRVPIELLDRWIAESAPQGKAPAKGPAVPSGRSGPSPLAPMAKVYGYLRARLLTFALGFVTGVLGSLAATAIYGRWEAWRTTPEVACLLLQEVQINQSTSDRKHALITEVMLKLRESPSNRQALSKLLELKYEHFSRSIYDVRAADLRFLPSTSRKHVEGLYVMLDDLNLNEAGLIDTILRDIGREDYHLRALAYPYRLLEERAFPTAKKSLQAFCYKSP